MPPIGSFECSNPLINQLQHNILWGQKGNFVDVPTDCPQRDERLGWTGDAQAFIRTACFNLDVAAFFTKWLADLRADQLPNGACTFVVPDVLTRRRRRIQPLAARARRPGATPPSFARGRSIELWRHAAARRKHMPVWWAGSTLCASRPMPIWSGGKGFQFGDWLDYRGSFALKPSPGDQ